MMAEATTLKINDRVEAGEPGTDEYDRGTVSAIDGDQVTVNWDSEVKTTQPASLLRRI